MSLKSLSVNWGYSSPPESIFIVVLDGLFKLVVTFVKAWWKSSHSFTQVGQWLPWLFIHWYWPLQQPPFIQAKQEGNVCEFRAQFNRPSPVSSVSNLTVTHLSVSPSVSVSVPSSLLLPGLLWLVGTHSLSLSVSLSAPPRPTGMLCVLASCLSVSVSVSLHPLPILVCYVCWPLSVWSPWYNLFSLPGWHGVKTFFLSCWFAPDFHSALLVFILLLILCPIVPYWSYPFRQFCITSFSMTAQ